jgi:hypothetical protein
MTHPRWPAKRIFGAMAAPLMMAGVLTGTGAAGASASSCQSWTGVPPPSPGTSDNFLQGVSVISACDAWAVGSDVSGSGAEQTLIEHWDGSTWKQVPSPDPGSTDNSLLSVRAASATSIWAVGEYFDGVGLKALILHWNGTAWKQVPSPNPGLGNLLKGVRVVSARDAWAVGQTFSQTNDQTLILHWDGTKWKRVPSPAPGSSSELTSVAATSAGNAWAVGDYSTSTGEQQTLILHWNGTKWKQVPSPNPSSPVNFLAAVGAASPASAWAVGFVRTQPGNEKTLILHWNGTKWKRVPSPSPDSPIGLNGVAATSASNAWAVGFHSAQTLILHWNGTTWKQVPSPNPSSTSNNLFAVAAASRTDVWAVGTSRNGTAYQALALHCC